MSSSVGYHKPENNSSSSADSKKQSILKYVFSFMLSVVLTVLCVLICAEYVFLNPVYFEKSFTSYEYTVELYNRIDDFANISCKKANIGSFCVDEALTFKCIKDINDAYIGEKLGTENHFNNETYDYFVENLKAELKESILQQVKIDSAGKADVPDSSIDKMVNEIINYIDKSVSLSHSEDLFSIVSVSDIALKIAIAVFVLLAAVLSVIIYYIGNKRYKGLRFVSYSFGAASIINIAFAVIANIYAITADLTIYPKYLQYALESHISYSEFALLGAAAASFGLFAAILAFCWKLKRKNK